MRQIRRKRASPRIDIMAQRQVGRLLPSATITNQITQTRILSWIMHSSSKIQAASTTNHEESRDWDLGRYLARRWQWARRRASPGGGGGTSEAPNAAPPFAARAPPFPSSWSDNNDWTALPLPGQAMEKEAIRVTIESKRERECYVVNIL
jgi:hypothetical protein